LSRCLPSMPFLPFLHVASPFSTSRYVIILYYSNIIEKFLLKIILKFIKIYFCNLRSCMIKCFHHQMFGHLALDHVYSFLTILLIIIILIGRSLRWRRCHWRARRQVGYPVFAALFLVFSFFIFLPFCFSPICGFTGLCSLLPLSLVRLLSSHSLELFDKSDLVTYFVELPAYQIETRRVAHSVV